MCLQLHQFEFSLYLICNLFERSKLIQTLYTATSFKTQVEKATVTGLYYYPIKSCAGIQVELAEIDGCGFVHDRELMIVEAATGIVLTQREIPWMALVQPYIDNDYLHLTAPGMPALEVPLIKDGLPQEVSIWGNLCQAIDQGSEVTKWFSEYLKTDCRLVRMAPDFSRKLDPKYTITPDDQVNFADGYPFLLVSQESLDELNRRLEEPLPMNRFRPNIVIAGSNIAFCEDRLAKFSLGGVILHGVKLSERCTIITNNQETAVMGKEPLKTLATFRRIDGKVKFGQNVIQESRGIIRVGDGISVLEVSGESNTHRVAR